MGPLRANFLKRIVCGVSGGVDSAVAAYRLKKQGYEVIGVYMQNWDSVDEVGYCENEREAEDAEWACHKIGIPFKHVNFVKDYWIDVFCPFLDDYKQGLTPNPDILCNRYIKFGSFLKHVVENENAEFVATGHYARVCPASQTSDGSKQKAGVRLLTAVDPIKDQTFFLSQVNQEALQRSLFPLGEFYKSEVRNMALSAGLERLALKRDSVGICFIGGRSFPQFISQYIKDAPGNFIHLESGKVVGTHNGIHQWTIGQRCKLGGYALPLFAAGKNIHTQDIYVVEGTHHPALFHQCLTVREPHWIYDCPQQLKLKGSVDCMFRFQHTKPFTGCKIEQKENGCYTVTLDQPLRAITAGQYAVFYLGEECLGSSQILEPGPSLYEMQFQKRQIKTECELS